ncbi:CSEP0452 putative effector protein [Blumeria hordei DH14]|uniref:CSEP0452 putative effector protein n=1 Tax=Blumeria graminis f. sp. hordei (strain DH14) TaxID=546991 RepID=N1JHJ8_BLUG1|nr:CSEP0452 putative effector protein [Blumeria hordei DH14]
MIRCAVAFLLITGQSSDRLDRLVVTTDDVEQQSYGVYEVKNRDYITNSESIDASIFTETKIAHQGTFYMPYCSDHLDSKEIALKITIHLRDRTHRAHVGLVRDEKMENNCLQSLSSISNLGMGQTPINLSKCEKNMKKMCTSRTIMNLAFKGIIAVDGPYKAFAPRMADQPIVVTDDQPMDMSSLVLNGEMFARIRTEHEQIALAWYQGHLQLFKQNLRTNEWTPVTRIGSEMETGSLITNHILKALPDSKIPWTEFYKQKEHIVQAYKLPMRRKKSRRNYYHREIHDFFNSNEALDTDLLYNYPFIGFQFSRYDSESREFIRYPSDKNLQILRHVLTWSRKVCNQQLTPFRVTGTTGPSE